MAAGVYAVLREADVQEKNIAYCVASSEHDQYVREHMQVEPISEKEYNKGIEAIAGKCQCGGNRRLDAPPRCPKCHSMRIEEGETTIYYD